MRGKVVGRGGSDPSLGGKKEIIAMSYVHIECVRMMFMSRARVCDVIAMSYVHIECVRMTFIRRARVCDVCRRVYDSMCMNQ